MAVGGEGDGGDGGGGSTGCRTLCYVGLDLSTGVRGVGLLRLAGIKDGRELWLSGRVPEHQLVLSAPRSRILCPTSAP